MAACCQTLPVRIADLSLNGFFLFLCLLCAFHETFLLFNCSYTVMKGFYNEFILLKKSLGGERGTNVLSLTLKRLAFPWRASTSQPVWVPSQKWVVSQLYLWQLSKHLPSWAVRMIGTVYSDVLYLNERVLVSLMAFHLPLPVLTDFTASTATTVTMKLFPLWCVSLQYSNIELVYLADVADENCLFLVASNIFARKIICSLLLFFRFICLQSLHRLRSNPRFHSKKKTFTHQTH